MVRRGLRERTGREDQEGQGAARHRGDDSDAGQPISLTALRPVLTAMGSCPIRMKSCCTFRKAVQI